MNLRKIFSKHPISHGSSISSQHSIDDINKVKHLLDLHQDIIAVFTVVSSQISEIHLTGDFLVDKKWIKDVSDYIALEEIKDMNVRDKKCISTVLGKFRWAILEYDNIEIIKIIERAKTVVVVVKTDGKTLDVINDILGYYYDKDEQPTNLFL